MSRLLALLFLAVSLAVPAERTDVQLEESRAELKKLEAGLKEKRRQIELLKTEEKSVLNTLSLLDQNLNMTREYLEALGQSEVEVQGKLSKISSEIDSLDLEIVGLQRAMEARIRALYIQGDKSRAEALYRLLMQKENPERQLYLVHRLLNDDAARIETLKAAIEARNSKKRSEARHLSELKNIRQKKSEEEAGLKEQIDGQETALRTLQNDQEMQKAALAEFERNQKTMLSLIKKLEEKRRKELAEAKRKKEAEEKRKKEVKEKQKEAAKPAPKVAAGPKCLPLEGDVISKFGTQEHPVLHIPIRNLGVEIRGKKGAKIKAAAAGTVALVSEIDGRGPSVIIEHPGGFYSVYGHLSNVRVKEGDQVSNCEEIGVVGDVASLNGIKLYFQVSSGTEPLDPLKWLSAK